MTLAECPVGTTSHAVVLVGYTNDTFQWNVSFQMLFLAVNITKTV